MSLAKGILTENLAPAHEDEGMTLRKIGMYAANRPEWIITNIACWALNTTVVTLYATLGDEALAHCINETQLETILVDEKSFDSIMGKTENELISTVKNLILCFHPTSEQVENAEKAGIKVYTVDSLQEMGALKGDSILDEVEPATPDSIEVLCYTSGTTGMPKAAMLTHKNWVSSVKFTQL